MEKTIFEQMGGNYTLQGDYYLPNLSLPAEENKPIGIWGQRHLRYLKEYRRITYTNLLTSGKLYSYLADVDQQAEDMFSHFIKQMTKREGLSKRIKVENQMEWVGRMNNIRNRAVEIINTNLIFIKKGQPQ